MDLTTRYLGLELPNPLVCGASPLGYDLGLVRRLEDAGAAAIVLPSLFEEQVERRAAGADAHPGFAAQLEISPDLLPQPQIFALGPDGYLEHVHRVKAAVAMPVIASLNGTTAGGWLAYARMLEQAGADALELNVYELVTDPDASARVVEEDTTEMVAAICDAVMVPVAVKLSPWYTSLVHFARGLERAGAAGLVLFNRFYQPDVDLERLEVWPDLHLSDSKELLLRLRWLAILHGRLGGVSLAASGGVHSGGDVVKALLAGADAVQVVSLLLREGPQQLARLKSELIAWLVERGRAGVADVRGSLALDRCADADAYERANYLHLLHGPAAG